MTLDNENTDDDIESDSKELSKVDKKVASNGIRDTIRSCHLRRRDKTRTRTSTIISKSEKMNYDEILERHLGETGIFFTGNILLLWLPAIAAGMIVLQTSFTGLESEAGNLKRKCAILNHLSARALRVSLHHRGLREFEHCRVLGLQRVVHSSDRWRR